jgi:hypothetical protein
MEDCCGMMGHWFGHNFEARYDVHEKGEQDPIVGMFNHATYESTAEGIKSVVPEKFKKRTYVHDVCTRCGLVVKREQK